MLWRGYRRRLGKEGFYGTEAACEEERQGGGDVCFNGQTNTVVPNFDTEDCSMKLPVSPWSRKLSRILLITRFTKGFLPSRTSSMVGLAAVAAVFAGACLGAVAQDRRVVKEPVIPPVCTVVSAQLTEANGGLAAADEMKLDTARIQKAMDGCGKGKAVELKPEGGKTGFLSGPLVLRTGVTLLVDKGATLFGSRNPADYEMHAGSCGIVNDKGRECRPLIGATGAKDAAVMGDGVIDGRGGSTLLGGPEKGKTWWQLAEQARAGGRQQCPEIMSIDRSDNFTLYRITLKNSPNFHVMYRGGNGFTAWGVKIDTPKNARNTDGIDPSSAKNVTITHSWISTGDDNVAIKAGSDGPMTNVTISHNHFYYGHGVSIGSETNGGASAIRVEDLSIDGADNGIRIKSNPSRGGLVHDVMYSDVCLRNVKNPILMDTNYSYAGKATNLYPVFTGIVLRDVRIEGGGKITLNGLDAKHKLGIQFDGVMLDAPQSYQMVARDADVKMGPGPVNFRPTGDGVVVTGNAGQGSLKGCEGMLVPFPR